MAANQVTVATPGPAGVPGLTYEGLWVVGSVYQVRDCVRYTDGNLYVVNVQHTSASGNNPVVNTTYWSLFINANDAYQWATEPKHSLIGDSLGNAGYSALHQAAKAQDWATLTTDAVTNDTNVSDVEYSAKAWAIGGTEVTTTALRGAAKEWAIGTGRIDHPSTGGYSAKEHATGTTVAEGSAKEWAQTTGAAIDTTYSSKEYAQGAVLAAGGSAKNWAQLATTPTTTATDASAKEWATGVSTHKNEGSAKDWATYTTGDVRGASAGSMSAKEWAIGVLGRGVASEGSSKDWATRLAATVDNAGYSAQEWAVGTTASTGGSAKDWAIYTAADVRGASSGEMSAKEWALGVLGRGQANEGSSKDWATRVAATVDNAEYSAKEYSQGSVLAAGGSSKNWAQLATTPTTTATDASAKEWATGVSTHKNEGSSKDWAVYTAGDVRGAASGSMSSKEWSVGTQGRGVAGEGSSKDWATRLAATVDNADWSAKEFAIGTTASTGGSAKDWAIYTTADVRGASSGEMSSKEWAVGILGRGVSGEGSSKDWAIRTGATVDNAEYSAKEYAYGTTVAAGSAKDWAILAEDSVVDGSSGYSALHWAAKADDSRLAAKASAAAVANTFDAFDDTYLGSMRDAFIFTASSSSGLLITDNDHGLLDGNIVQVASTTTLPTGISAATNYYVRDKTTNTFKLATSSGGTAIAYTNAGSGVHSWVYGSPTTNGTWALNSSSITVVSNVGIRVGQKVSGTGIPTSPVPNVLSVVGTTVVISENMAAANVGTVAVTFSSLGINGPFSTTKDGPTTDNDGGALVNGMLYFNTTDNAMMIYKTVGTEWIAATASGGVSLVMHKVTASGGETSFAAGTFTPALTYEVNNIVVFLNGVRLDATDYTATTGTSITGLVAVAASDELTILAFKTFEVADAVSAVSGGTFTGAVTFNGGLTANTADINGGTFDGIVGGTTPAAGSFTTIGASGAITGALTGNASTATTLATARTIGMTGDVVWTSPTFDGSGNVTAVAAIQANSVTMGTDTTGNYVATVTAGTGLTSTGATSGESIAHSLSVDAAQTQITSVGTLTTLTVDNVIINGTTIGHTSDTDLLTLTSGNLAVAGDVFPSVDATSDLGSASKRWDNIYTTDLHLANERGNWTIIEEENYLSIRNNKTDKIYKLIMEELHDNEPHIE